METFNDSNKMSYALLMSKEKYKKITYSHEIKGKRNYKINRYFIYFTNCQIGKCF